MHVLMTMTRFMSGTAMRTSLTPRPPPRGTVRQAVYTMCICAASRCIDRSAMRMMSATVRGARIWLSIRTNANSGAQTSGVADSHKVAKRTTIMPADAMSPVIHAVDSAITTPAGTNTIMVRSSGTVMP